MRPRYQSGEAPEYVSGCAVDSTFFRKSDLRGGGSPSACSTPSSVVGALPRNLPDAFGDAMLSAAFLAPSADVLLRNPMLAREPGTERCLRGRDARL